MELLRDVLRTDDAAGRTRRRWLLIPISVLLHALAAVAYFVIPLAAAVTLPTPAPPFALRHWAMPVASPPAPSRPAVARADVRSAAAAPVEAPPQISAERSEAADRPDAPGAIEGPPEDAGLPDGLGAPAAGVPRPAPPPLPEAVAPAGGPVRVGGRIRAPARLGGTAPVYPPIAMSARVEGDVVLEALIDERGRVENVRVTTSVPLLDGAAVDAVRSWRYSPTLLNGAPVQVLMTVTVHFSLQK